MNLRSESSIQVKRAMVEGPVEEDSIKDILNCHSQVDSKNLESGCRISFVGCLSCLGLGLEDGHVETFWLLL